MLDRLILFPYWITLSIRNACWRNSKRVRKSGVPTICVGNITVGGTGKTPHTEMILRMLQQSDEWGSKNIAVLSRGYKRSSKGFQQVSTDASAGFCGDEPLQMKRKFPSVTVAVDKNRVEGCDFLTHPEKLQNKKNRKAKRCADKNFPAADLIILDDAFQYRKLKSDLNIVLVDWNRPVFEDSLLPIGRLRDLTERVHEADIIIVSKCPGYVDSEDRQRFAKGLGFKSYNEEDGTAVTLKGTKQTLLFTRIGYAKSTPMFSDSDPRYIYSKNVIVFTGIANDTPLIQYLSDSYHISGHICFPDHHKFKRSDFSKIAALVKHNPTAALATTEKDAQRVIDYSKVAPDLRRRMFFVPIEPVFLKEEEEKIFRQKLLSI